MLFLPKTKQTLNKNIRHASVAKQVWHSCSVYPVQHILMQHIFDTAEDDLTRKCQSSVFLFAFQLKEKCVLQKCNT